MGGGGGERTYQRVRLAMFVLACVGLGLSVYALYVETAKEKDEDYKAMCDISPSISCSKVFTSKYGRGFGLVGRVLGEDHPLNLPNSIPGIIFYTAIIVMGEMRSVGVAVVQRAVVSLSNFMSLYLAYLLYFVLRDLCVVCVSTYLVNLALTGLTFLRVTVLRAATTMTAKIKVK